MLRKNQKALQVEKNGIWEYVFCYNTYDMVNGPIITTKNRSKALNAKYDLQFFTNKFGNYNFKSE